MSLRSRLERLEEIYGGGGGGPPCDECGGGGGGDDDASAIEYELTFPGDREDDVPDPVEEFCTSCGRQLIWVLNFPDERDTRRQGTST